MAEKNDPMLLIDRRFLMDFLTGEQAPEGKVAPEPENIDRISREEMAVFAELYHKHSLSAGRKFSRVSMQVFSQVSKEDFYVWADTGIRLLGMTPEHERVVDSFLESTPSVLASGSFAYFKGWVDTGERISGLCTRSAAAYYRFTPLFLNQCDIYHIRRWADWGIEILNCIPKGDGSAVLFFENSIDHLKFMTFRELKEWKNLGLAFLKTLPALGHRFFSSTAEGFSCMHWPERNILYRLTSALLKIDGEKALEFFMRSPFRLAEAGPNTRDTILGIVEKLTRFQPEKIVEDFDLLMDAQRGMSYPTREIILQQAERLTDLSVDAARVFIKHVPDLVSLIPEEFLSRFVDFGVVRYLNGDNHVVQYFSLSTDDAFEQILKWGNAVLLEDYSHILAVFAEALTGKVLSIKKTQPEHPDFQPGSEIYPATDGKTIFLPPFVADGKTVNENFRYYKAATAHQAGYLEFGSFDNGLNLMLGILECFPQKDLALDIFIILEDGRIDWMLMRQYRGLEEDLRQIITRGLKNRKSPDLMPLWSALVEILLRLSLMRFDKDDEVSLSGFFEPHVRFLRRALSGFYNNGTTIRHCFSKAIEIYTYISRLPNEYEHQSGEMVYGTGKNGEPHMYREIPPLAFRGKMDLPKDDDPVSLDVGKTEAGDERGGTPLTPEELKQWIDRMIDPLEVLKAAEQKISSSPGIFIRNRDKINFKKITADEEMNDGCPVNPDVLSGSVSGSVDGPFYYDEWDHLQGAYRKNWCCLSEKTVHGITSTLIDDIYKRHANLIWKVKHQFQQIRPQIHEVVPRVEWGDEIDLPAVVQVVVDKKSGSQPSDKIFNRKEKKIRKIAVLFLIDMSASTGNPASSLNTEAKNGTAHGLSGHGHYQDDKKIIDIEIESLVVIMEALEALKDEYAIYGFSGYGRKRVDFYRIKDFDDIYSDELKRRIAGIAPKQSTRMGPAIRHATRKLASLETQQRLLILLSDGFPQDSDYGEDRTSHEYGLHDTMMALLEAKNHGVRPFCITVDQGGSDYLKKMCDPRNYLVIQDIFSLPEVLPKVVESLIEY